LEPCAHRPIANSQILGDLLQGPALRSHLQNPVPVHGPHGAAQLFAIRPRIPNPRTHPLPDQIALKLCDRTNDCEERLPQRAARVDVLLITYELDAELPKLLQRRKQVFGGASEPIKAPHHDYVELPLPRVVPPQFSTSVLLTHAIIMVYIWQYSEDSHEHLPSPGPSEAPERHQ
jgi:hypothetical protein